MTGKARILFVDDEKRVLNSMRGLFRRDYELFLTSEGAEAVRIAAENEIDVIVADQRMPGMTGIEVLGAVKKASPRTVRILLTGYADPSAVEGSINIGEVFRFLSKPCPPKMLRETLGLAIEASRTTPVETVAEEVASSIPEAPVRTAVAPQPEIPAQTQAPAQPEMPARPVASTPAPSAEPSPLPDPEPMVQTSLPPQTPAQDLPPVEELSDNEDTQPALPIIDEGTIETTADHSSTHWQSVTNVVMSEDTIEETQENVALTESKLGIKDVGVAVFTIDSDFASTAIRAISADRNTILATTLVKVAHAIEEQNAGVLVTDFTTNNTMLKKMIGALKQHMPELVTIVVSNGRDTTDMINLINYGQVFRYVLKPIEPEQLRSDINAAVIRHLYLRNNPDSAKRHEVIDTPLGGEDSTTLNRFLGKFRRARDPRTDPTDTIA